jgi:Zn-dependent peptidase ImmA (M78 family)
VRSVIQDKFGIPLVQLEMSRQLAGATLANGNVRGILINESVANRDLCIRRMALAHELGHLLWDPEDRLQRVKVDGYDELELSAESSGRDPVETRANAFAIAFLAPPQGVRALARSERPSDLVLSVMAKFGISATSARYHVANVTGVPVSSVAHPGNVDADDSWQAAENLTIDVFPLDSTPISRRGRFAEYVVKANQRAEISADTAAHYLKTTKAALSDLEQSILNLFQ